MSYYLPEAGSEAAQRAIRDAKTPTISDLVQVEFASAIARRIRMGELEAAEAIQIAALFETHVVGGFYNRILLKSHHLVLAKELLGISSLPLTTLDSLHLALTRIESMKLSTADRALAKAAEASGADVSLVS